MLNFLKSIPFVGTAVGFLTSKFRLVIEYGLIAAVVTLCAVAVSLWGAKKRTELNLATTETRLVRTESRLTTVESVNQAHEETIKDLKTLRGQDAKALDGLLNDYRILAQSDTKVRTRLHNLENSNANVRDYLSLPVPVELRCLLNNTCTPSNPDSDEDRKGTAAERPSKRL